MLRYSHQNLRSSLEVKIMHMLHLGVGIIFSVLIQNLFLIEWIERGHNFQSLAPVSLKYNMKPMWQLNGLQPFSLKINYLSLHHSLHHRVGRGCLMLWCMLLSRSRLSRLTSYCLSLLVMVWKVFTVNFMFVSQMQWFRHKIKTYLQLLPFEKMR